MQNQNVITGEIAQQKRFSITANHLLILFFVLALFTPAVIMFITPDETVSLAEKRNLAAPLDVTTWIGKPVEAITAEIEGYVKDHFGLRNVITSAYGLVKFNVFNKAPNSRVTVGKDGWLFYTEGNLLNEYRGMGRLSRDYLDRAAATLTARRDWLAQYGIKYYVMITPEKQTIYPEYMPDAVTILQERRNFDQFIKFFETNTDLTIIDPRENLLAAKDDQVLYHRYDTHWNMAGGFIGYQTLMQPIQADFPDITLLSEDQLVPSVFNSTGDLATMMNLGSFLTEDQKMLYVENPCAIEREYTGPQIAEIITISAFECGQAAHNAVIFHDSFFGAMLPFVSENFKQSIFVFNIDNNDTSYNQDYLQQLIDAGQAPDLVIQQFVERKIAFYFDQ